MRNCVIVFAKNPIPNHVKTRLIPRLSAEQATALYRAFLTDWCETLSKLSTIELIIAYTPEGSQPDLQTIIGDAVTAYTPEGSQPDLQTIIGDAVTYIPQIGDGLGERLTSATHWASENGYEKIIITGSDSPTLPLAYISQAVEALDTCDVVVGPSVDGGYYLIGLSNQNLTDVVPTIYEGIAWSTKHVLQQTVERIHKINAKLKLLPVWYDVDTPEDLDFLQAHLSALRLAEGSVQAVRTEKILLKLLSKENL